ncbi:proline racemase family protein [Aliiroseovarius marinus]|uniref:4-hydroxyproline epimerase n=1 Tax=Aliiroseovarius marinus TaxID=2500159 RepID=UPI003D7E7D88
MRTGKVRADRPNMKVVDSHTAGEPTRVILSGGPDLGPGTVAQKAEVLRNDHAWIYSAVLNEPRGHDAIVGAYLVESEDPSCSAGVIFFNTVGNLGMCGHATIGLAVTLAYLGRISPGVHRFETPVGVVAVDLLDDNTVRVTNVPSYRHLKNVTVAVDGLGQISGDVAWGGNWFFLTSDIETPLQLSHVNDLTVIATRIRDALVADNITGQNGAFIDHIEFSGPALREGSDARNFVLCPGGAFDRSPCGTGSSAKLACLAEDGCVAPGDTWVQESIIGSRYRLKFQHAENDRVVPEILGRAYVTALSELIFSCDDPYMNGIS